MIFLVVSISGLLGTFSVVSILAKHVTVTGLINGTATLPCNYSTSKGTYTMCWGRGSCAKIYCKNRIIEADSRTVTWRISNRYQLLGNISQGDVSLTISGATEDDEGTYCCRVEIPGPFNDKKEHVSLEIKKKTDHEDGWELPTSLPIPKSFTNLTQASSPSFDPQIWNNEAYFFLIFVILAAILLTTVALYIYKFKKRKASVRTGQATELNNLSSPVNQTGENFYILD
ncbi:hepatitis A virus cellular receptor 1 homolog [Dendrobates tinctorius]|uniref:hepatitis A virus cellular receptor 1 homolog n=1 Tax=Dendrobates tinctorius TaxID=92724 RepID=UPI003CCA280C